MHARLNIWLIAAAGLWISLGHLLFGGLAAGPSLVIDAGWALLAIGASLLLLRRPARAYGELWPLAALFALTLLAALWSLSSFSPRPAGAARPSASIDHAATLLQIVHLFGLGFAFITAFLIGLRERGARRALKWAGYGGAGFVVLAFLLVHSGLTGDRGGRFEALFLSPNTAGELFGVLTCLCAALALRQARSLRRMDDWMRFGLSGLTALICLIALAMTSSRGATAATAVGLTILFAGQAWSGRWSIGASIGVGLTCGSLLLAGLAVSGVAVDRFAAAPFDAVARGQIAASAWRGFLAAPWAGHGLGSFGDLLKTQAPSVSLSAGGSAKNLYLQWLSEAGLLGSLPMFLCVGGVIGVTVWRVARNPYLPIGLYALLGADAIVLLHSLVDPALQTPSISLFWSFLLGLQLAWSGEPEEHVAPAPAFGVSDPQPDEGSRPALSRPSPIC